MQQNNLTDKKLNQKLDDYQKIEINQVFERVQLLENKRMQIGSFFGMANLTALGVSFSAQKAGLLFFAATILIIYIVIDMRIRTSLGVSFYRGLQLQKKYLPDDEEAIWLILPGRLFSKVREISELENYQDRLSELTKLHISTPSSNGFWIPLAIIVLEVIAGFFLWIVTSWPLF